jgi:hypothetical protein
MITYKWDKVDWFLKYFMMLPHCIFLFTHLFWYIYIRPEKEEWPNLYYFTVAFIFILIFYLSLIEIKQMATDCMDYIEDWALNITQIWPYCSVSFTVLKSLI